MAPLGHPKKPILQLGHAWLVSLIVLSAAATLCFVAFRSLDNKSTSFSLDERGKVFEATEAALTYLKSELISDPPEIEAFSEDCNWGYCFSDHYVYDSDNEVCVPNIGSEEVNFLTEEDFNIWALVEKHQILTIKKQNFSVKYFLHLLCQVPSIKDSTEKTSRYQIKITVLGEGQSANSSVALESIISLNMP